MGGAPRECSLATEQDYCGYYMSLAFPTSSSNAPNESAPIASLLSSKLCQTRLDGGDVFLITHNLRRHAVSSEAAEGVNAARRAGRH